MDKTELYLEFRKEIDKICVPEILQCVETIPIMEDGKQVGILCVRDEGEWVYIDSLYIIPEHRRKGLARREILKWFKRQKKTDIRLHIINKNEIAYRFWTSIFKLEEIDWNYVDTLYRIRKVI